MASQARRDSVQVRRNSVQVRRNSVQARKNSFQLPSPDSPNFAQFVLSQILDYDEERKELQRRLKELKYLQLRRAQSVFLTGPDASASGVGAKSTPLQRRRTSSIVGSDFTRFHSGGIDILGTFIKFNTLSLRPNSGGIGEEDGEYEDDESDGEKEKEKEHVENDNIFKVESPVVPQLMSSEAIRALTDLKSHVGDDKLVALTKRGSVITKAPISGDVTSARLRASSIERRPPSGQKLNSNPRPKSGMKKVEFDNAVGQSEVIAKSLVCRRSKTDTDLVRHQRNAPQVDVKGYSIKKRKKRKAQIYLKKEGRGIFIKYDEVSDSDDQNESESGIDNEISSASKGTDDEIPKDNAEVEKPQQNKENRVDMKTTHGLPNIEIMEPVEANQLNRSQTTNQ